MCCFSVLKRGGLFWAQAGEARGGYRGRVSVPGRVVGYWRWFLLEQCHCCVVCVVGFPQRPAEHRNRTDVWTQECVYTGAVFIAACAVPAAGADALPHACNVHRTHVMLARSSHWCCTIKKLRNMVVSGSFGCYFVNILSRAGCCPCLRGVHTNRGGACSTCVSGPPTRTLPPLPCDLHVLCVGRTCAQFLHR